MASGLPYKPPYNSGPRDSLISHSSRRMTSADQQLLAAYKSGLSPEQIAEDLGFHTHNVKARLMALSTEYRKACGAESPEEDELNFTRDEQLSIKRELFQMAMSTEDQHLKVKLLLNLRDDGKGRKDIVRDMKNAGNINIMQLINNSISSASQSADSLISSIRKPKLIDA